RRDGLESRPGCGSERCAQTGGKRQGRRLEAARGRQSRSNGTGQGLRLGRPAETATGDTGKQVRAAVSARQIWSLVKASVSAWSEDYAPSMGAAIAYYTLFSIAPLLVIVIAIAGLVFGPEAARNEIAAQLQGLIGQEGAMAVQGLLKSANQPAQGVVATIV